MLTPQQASFQASQQKEAEEYRLLYVAMTRAKKLLWISASKKAPWRWNFFTDYGSKSKLDNKQPSTIIQQLANDRQKFK